MITYPQISPEAMAVALALDQIRAANPILKLRDAMQDLLEQPSSIFDRPAAMVVCGWLELTRVGLPDADGQLKMAVILTCNRAIAVRAVTTNPGIAQITLRPETLLALAFQPVATDLAQHWKPFWDRATLVGDAT